MKKLILSLIYIIANCYYLFAQPTIQWQKIFGGTNLENAFSVQQTSDGGCIIAGSSSSEDGDVTGNHGTDDYWIIKLNSLGILEWQKSYGR